MIRKLTCMTIFMLFFSTAATVFAAQECPQPLRIEAEESKNQEHDKKWYQAHALYLVRLKAMIKRARHYLEKAAHDEISKAYGVKPAVIFDIDGTLLKDSHDWGDSAGKTIPLMVDLFNYVKSLDAFDIYLMTARSINEEIETRSELAQARINGFKECILMPFGSELTAGQWKALIRGNLQKNELLYIVATFDDNEEVLDYGALGEGFLVPRIFPLPQDDDGE